jgi:hypothetical protein
LIVGLFILAIAAVTIGGAVTAFNAGSDALGGITSTIDSSATPTTKKTTPSSGTSLMNAKALKAALAKLPKGDIVLLRLEPARLDANVIAGGKLHVAQVTSGGDVRDITTPGSTAGDPVKVNSAAPMRIARTAAKRAGRPLSSINYLVLIHILGKDEWQLYFKDGAHYTGSANGKRVHKVG